MFPILLPSLEVLPESTMHESNRRRRPASLDDSQMETSENGLTFNGRSLSRLCGKDSHRGQLIRRTVSDDRSSGTIQEKYLQVKKVLSVSQPLGDHNSWDSDDTAFLSSRHPPSSEISLVTRHPETPSLGHTSPGNLTANLGISDSATKSHAWTLSRISKYPKTYTLSDRAPAELGRNAAAPGLETRRSLRSPVEKSTVQDLSFLDAQPAFGRCNPNLALNTDFGKCRDDMATAFPRTSGDARRYPSSSSSSGPHRLENRPPMSTVLCRNGPQCRKFQEGQ